MSGECAVAPPEPYWQSPDGRITVYHSRWEDVHAAGLLPVRELALVHADPPYGIDVATDRSKSKGGKKFPKIVGDKAPFDPSGLVALDRPSVLWGANNYAARLPDSYAWFVWDKLGTMEPFDGSDAEMAWTNIGASVRLFRHMWRGVARESELSTVGLHPTQKPVALSLWVFTRAKLRPGDLVFVPYLGSGPDLPAALAMGLRVIACDVESWCCRTAVGRLGAINQEAAAEPVGPLFGARQ